MLPLLNMSCLEISRALPRCWAVVCPTEEARGRAGAAIGIVEATTVPATGLPVAGNVAVAEQEAASAPWDREGVRAHLVHCRVQHYPFR